MTARAGRAACARGRALAAPALAAALALAACSRRDAPTSCRDALGGPWRVDGAGARTPGGEPRAYDVLDLGRSVEVYPMFDDSVLAPGAAKDTRPGAVVVAPAAFDLTRTADGEALVGTQHRRYERAGAICVVRTPARITGCAGGRATLEATPVGPPADWTTCRPGPPAPSVRWTLVRE